MTARQESAGLAYSPSDQYVVVEGAEITARLAGKRGDREPQSGRIAAFCVCSIIRRYCCGIFFDREV